MALALLPALLVGIDIAAHDTHKRMSTFVSAIFVQWEAAMPTFNAILFRKWRTKKILARGQVAARGASARVGAV
jgi:hypothetical protein